MLAPQNERQKDERAGRVRRAHKLRAAGLSHREVAEALGVTRDTAKKYIRDPGNDDHRVRVRRYREESGALRCGCGKPKSASSESCAACGYVRAGNTQRRVEWVSEDRGYETPCWIWQGSLGAGGYGRIRHGRALYAHRYVYEIFVGPIPDGLTLDHLCRQRACVNPTHLEPVTVGENVRRGWVRRRSRTAI